MNPNVSLFPTFPVFSTFEVVLVLCCLIFILTAVALTGLLLTALILLSILRLARSDVALLHTHQLYPFHPLLHSTQYFIVGSGWPVIGRPGPS